MRVLTLNCGSSSLRFKVLELDREATTLGGERRVASGMVEAIGGRGIVELTGPDGAASRQSAPVADHGQATRHVLGWLASLGLAGTGGLDAVGHRVVHGGDRFREPVVLDDAVVSAIEAAVELAPLHNRLALTAIRAARAALGPEIPMVATFDTAFHSGLPEWAARYPIPPELAARHGIRRYGFHGIAVRYMVQRYASITATPVEQARLIALQLGNGCSATAVQAGRSVDTSMGLTPLEGLMMGTRSGDVDPSLAGLLARKERVDVAEAEAWLNTRSGLLGVSGHTRDMRQLLEAKGRGDARSALALEMFCYRVRKYIGAYLAALGGADAIVFGGGIGENAPEVRARICAGMDWCGLELDQERNAGTVGSEGQISTDAARLHTYVIPVDEAAIIARDTLHCLREHLRV